VEEALALSATVVSLTNWVDIVSHPYYYERLNMHLGNGQPASTRRNLKAL